MLIGLFIGFVTPDSVKTSPSAAIQWGLLNILSGVVSLVGILIILITAGVSVRKSRKLSKCPNCGCLVPKETDLFCRSCGCALTK